MAIRWRRKNVRFMSKMKVEVYVGCEEGGLYHIIAGNKSSTVDDTRLFGKFLM